MDDTNISKTYTKTNVYLILAGVICILLGHLLLFLMKDQPYDNPVSMIIVPIIFTLGYLVLIPVGLLYKKKVPEKNSNQT